MYIRVAKVLFSVTLMLFIVAAQVLCSARRAIADTPIHNSYLQILQSAQPFLSPVKTQPSIAQLQSLLDAAEKYFSAKRQHEQILFSQLQERQFNNGRFFSQEAPYPPQKITVHDVLIQVFDNAITPQNIKAVSLAGLILLRDLLRQLKTLDQGHLSGAVWLYDSPLPGFSTQHLISIDDLIIKRSLADAVGLRKKHQYAAAQKIYKSLLKDYAETENGRQIKVLLTAAIVEDYNYRAKIAFAKHDYKKGRTALQHLAALFPNSEISTKALADLKKMVSRAVVVNKKAGDSHYKAKTQYGVPQKEAAVYYQRTYEADPEGPQAPYALYWWSRALVTEGKYKMAIEKLQLLLRQFPLCDMRAQATYSLGFDYMINKDYPKAKVLFQKVVENYGDTDRASEALWQMAIQDAIRNNFPEALKSMQMLHDRYPKSPRWPHSAKWVKVFKEKIRTGGTWP